MRVRRCAVIAPIGLLAVILGSAARAGAALPNLEEHTLRSTVIIVCHRVQSDQDRAYIELADAVGTEAFSRVWEELNVADPRDLVANGMKADELLRRRVLKDADDAQKQIQEKGCTEMDRITAPMQQTIP